MGEAKGRSRNREQVLAASSRCIYCSNMTNLTVEHMPPRGLFKQKDRPDGWEFAVCETCNQGTRGADALAQFMAKTEAITEQGWKLPSNLKLRGIIEKHAPGVMDELFDDTLWKTTLIRRNGLLYRSKVSRADGPLTKRHLNRFAAKAAMAAFFNFTNRPLKVDGLIYTEWYLNGGFSQETYDSIVSILPMFTQLKQGKKESGDQFWLRYNTNNVDIVASLFSFHNSFFVHTIATDNSDLAGPIEEMLTKANASERPTVNMTCPAEFSLLMPIL